MTDDDSTVPPSAEAQPRWQPIGATDRRVLGALAEKAKTTPDSYPMSLNAICNACNQKSNRFPVMKLQPEDVEESLDRLRDLGAVGMIEGYGRVAKYRHYLYQWLGVDRVELAVMTELLLRGAQTEGELRGRAARMEPISDLSALRPVVTALKSKRLLIPLTPEGRGHVVTHALYQPGELENLRAQYGQGPVAPAPASHGAAEQTTTVGQPFRQSAIPAFPPPTPAASTVEIEALEGLRREVGELRSQVAQLRSDQDDLLVRFDQMDAELQRLKDALGG